MPISITCPSCGKKLSAPESAAGKRAKCPKCATIVMVPNPQEPIVDEPVAENPLDPDFDDLGLPAANPYASPPPVDEPERRPCPACGEMIVASAAKCRFCGEVFDPTLTRVVGSGKRELCTEARDALIYSIIGIFCLGFILEPLALIKAHTARTKIAADPSLTGSGMALAATIIAIISLVIMLLSFLAIFAGN